MWRIVKNSIYRNVTIRAIIILLLTGAMLIICAAISGVLDRFNDYIIVSDYLSKEGYYIDADVFTRKATEEEKKQTDCIAFFFNDEIDIKKYLPNVNSCLVGENYKETKIKNIDDSEVWEYGTEMTQIINPVMEEGHWFTDSDLDKDNELLNAVVTTNDYNIHVGDIVKICDDLHTAEVRVIGVIAEGEKLFNLSIERIGNVSTSDYRQMYSEVEKNQGVKLIISTAQILNSEATGGFGEFNYRVESEQQFMKSVSGCIVLDFEKKLNEKEKSDFFEYIGTVSSFYCFAELSEFNKASYEYIFSQLFTMIPIFICVVFVIIIASVSANMVIAKKELKHYSIYYLCGLSWKKCSILSLLSSLINVLISWLLLGIIYYIVYIAKLDAAISMNPGIVQFSVCCIFCMLFMFVSWLAPLIITNKTSAKEIISKSR